MDLGWLRDRINRLGQNFAYAMYIYFHSIPGIVEWVYVFYLGLACSPLKDNCAYHVTSIPLI